jgi:hypothetical protein
MVIEQCVGWPEESHRIGTQFEEVAISAPSSVGSISEPWSSSGGC